MTKIIGLAGKKQSGKGSCATFLVRNARKLWPDLDHDGWRVSDRVETFPFADPIKQFCLDVLGLSPEQVYGTNEQKNTLTRYRWEDLPHYDWLCRQLMDELFQKDQQDGIRRAFVPPTGLMTARQVMQQVGSSMRRWHPDVWVDATFHDIERSGASVAIIDDVRHPNEVEAILKSGGVVYRTTRVIDPTDSHESEVGLDPDRFDWSRFSGIIDNKTQGVRWTLLALFGLLVRDGVVSQDVQVNSLDFGDAK